jgi:hypothetical protein
MSHLENKSAVYPAGKANEGAAHGSEQLAKRNELGTVEILEIVDFEACHVFPISTAYPVSPSTARLFSTKPMSLAHER